MGWLLNLIGSGLVGALGNGILKPVLAHLDKKQDVALERDKALVSAEIATNAQRLTYAVAFKPIVYCTWAPYALHSAAVCVVSTFGLPFTILALPPAFQQWEAAILLAPFVVGPVTTLTSAIAARISR